MLVLDPLPAQRFTKIIVNDFFTGSAFGGLGLSRFLLAPSIEGRDYLGHIGAFGFGLLLKSLTRGYYGFVVIAPANAPLDLFNSTAAIEKFINLLLNFAADIRFVDGAFHWRQLCKI